MGDYPIDDEWAFARALLHLREAGQLRILDWNPMTLVAHLAWGWLWTLPGGVHFTALHLSSVALLAVECLAVVALLRRLGVGEGAAAVSALCLAANPLHLFQAVQYATDIPTLAWTTLALLLYARGLEAKGGPAAWRSLALGSLCAALAFLVRQPGLLVAGALAAYALLFDRRRARQGRFWLAGLGAPLLAVAGFGAWYTGVHGPTSAYLRSSREVAAHLAAMTPGSLVAELYFLLAMAAFFLLPVLLAAPARAFWPGGHRRQLAALGVLAAILGAFLWVTFGLDLLFPYLRNKITRFGLLSPNELILGARDILWPQGADRLASVLLLLGALLLGLRAAAARLASPTLRLAGLLLALQLAYLLATGGIGFDRHLLILAPTALILFVGSLGPALRLRPGRAALALLPFAAYAVATSHDWHAISRTAARAQRQLVGAGLDPELLDAGYAATSYAVYERGRRERAAGLPPRARRGDIWYIRSLDPRVLTCTVLSLSPRMDRQRWLPGLSPWALATANLPSLASYRVVGELPYTTWCPHRQRHLYVLADRRPACRGRAAVGLPGGDP